MADYTGLIRVGVEGLGEINRLNTALQRASSLLANLENAQVITGQIGEGAARNVRAAAGDVGQAIRDMRGARRTQASVAQRRDSAGRYAAGGGTMEQRRLANQAYEEARARGIAAKRRLAEEQRNQQVVFRADQRYARAADRVSRYRENIPLRTRDIATQLNSVSNAIGQGSRGNYLTNLFQGRQREFARGGAGVNLSPQLQAQARNVRAAWDIATAGGQENLRLMQRLATEMAGLTRQQNELNRGRSGRSVAFEAGRRGQERITDLSRMPGADPARIRRLRSQATNVIATSNLGDIAGSRDANRRLNASIDRYQRQLDGAARELRIAQRRGGPVSPIRGSAYTPGSPAYIDRMARIGGPRESAKGRKDLVGSPAYIEEQRKQQSQQLQRAISAGGPRESAKGRKDLVGSPAYYEEQQRQLQKAISTGGPRESVKGRKDVPGSPAYIEEQRKQQAQQLQRAVRAGGPRESVKGRKEVAGSPAYYEEQQRQLQRAIRAGGPSEKIAGRKDLTGSPAYLEEQRKQQSQQLQRAIRAGGASEKISGRKDLPGSPAFYEEQRKQLDRAIRAGGPREKIAGRKDLPGSPAYIEAQRREADRAAALQRRQNERELQAQQRERDRIARLRQIASPIRGTATMVGSPAYLDAQARAQRAGGASGRLGPASPIGGTKTMVGSPAYLAEQRRQQGQQGFFRGNARKAVGEGLIGGAFPLLFGQGIGASAGGFAGGAIGGAIGGSFGFGLSLAGTAIGQAVDTTAQNLVELADAIRSPSKALDALEKSGLASSRSLEGTRFYVDQLTAVGRAYDAQTLVLQEVQKRLGPGSLTELNNLDTAQQKLQEQWGAMAAEIQVRLLPVLQGFVEFLASAAGDIGGFSSQSRLQRTDPQAFERLRSQAIRETSGPLGAFGDKKKYEARLSELSKQELNKRFANERAKVSQTPQEKFDAGTAQIQESRKLADQIQSAYREAFSLQRQAYDLQRDGAMLNRDIADYSYKKEREIFDLRQQAAEKAIDNRRASTQNRIESSDLSAREAFSAAVGFEQQLLTNVRESVRARKEGEADIEQSRKKLELAMARLNRDLEDYKRTNAREIQDIEQRKLSYARSVEDYKMKVADYVLQRSRESADLMRQAMLLGAAAPGATTGGGLASAVDRIGGAYQFRGTELAARKQPGDYQSDPRENFFFDRRPELINKAKARISTLTKEDKAALAFTVLTEAGPTDIGKMDVAANLLVRSASLGNAPISAVAKQPGQYTGVNKYGRIDLESEARGRQVFGARYDQTLNMLNGGMTGAGSAMPAGGVIARTGATGVGTGPHLDVRWADGRPITSADADRFIRVAGKVPSSFGVTSGYGPRRAPTAGASSFHKGIDFGTPAGTPVSLTGGARLVGSMTEAQSGGGGIVGIIDTPMGRMKLLHLEKVLTGNIQGQTAAQISNIQQPKFDPVPIGATPSAAPTNAANAAARQQSMGGEKEAQRILKEQNKLKQKGIELGQIEQILQGNQLPQLQQQGNVLQQQIEARQKILDLSDNAASIADIEAESRTRLAQIEKDRTSALASAQKQYGDDPVIAKQINEQADAALKIAKGEERQRRINLDLNNKLQNQEQSRSAILQLQQGLSIGKAEAAALERGELKASNVELLLASELYKRASEEEKAKLVTLTAQTEELSKQNEFRKQVNEIRQDARFTGAGLRAGLIGAPARAYEQGLKTFEGDKGKAMTLANETKLLENQQLVWGNLEKDITSVSDAISGALTNGLVDIVSGAREIQDVGRDMLNSIAGSFADTAQQQLGSLIQRQLGGLLGGTQGPLVKMLGAGGEVVGPQALGNASVFAAGEVTAFGVALQVVAAQMALFNAQSGLGSTLSGGLSSVFSGGGGSTILGGLGSLFSGSGPALSGGLGSALSSVPTSLFSKALTTSIPFGGFLAQGGTTKPGEGYIVGEKEPEFFFPGVSGRVVPRSDMEKAAALRQGDTQSDPLELDYTVTVQQGERFVSEEQMRRNNASLLKQAQARTYAGMRNNNEVRSFVGI